MPLTIDQLHTCFQSCTQICTDSRKVEKGDLFFALKGPNFDGNVYAAKALEKGAAYAVIDNPDFQTNERCLLVEDTLKSLQELATHHRKLLNPTTIAITGTNGKTTTKELVKSVLATTYKTQATIGNFNNHIGVPLTLLGLQADTEMAIIEMGANKPYDIDELCRIALPEFGLITNIGKAHLEGFGSLKGVIKTKGELFDFLDASGGYTFLNMNDFEVAKIGYFIQRAATYGSGQWYKTDVQLQSADPFLIVNWYPESGSEPIHIETQLIGAYNLDNVAAAIALGTYFKVPANKIKQAIEAYQPSNKRSQILKKNGNAIILDAYNANPTSMKAALQNFAKMKSEKKIVILGDMLEMGKVSQKEHQHILKLVADMELTQVVLVGAEMEKANKKHQFLHFSGVQQARTWFEQQQFQDALILLKGSRGIALEKIIE